MPTETTSPQNDNEESKEPEVDEALFAEAGGDEEIDFDWLLRTCARLLFIKSKSLKMIRMLLVQTAVASLVHFRHDDLFSSDFEP